MHAHTHTHTLAQHTHMHIHTHSYTLAAISQSNRYHISLSREAGALLEDSPAIPVADIVHLFDINSADSSGAVDQLLKAYPIMNVTLGEHSVLINCHDLVINSDCFECLLQLGQQKGMPKQSSLVHIGTSSNVVELFRVR